MSDSQYSHEQVQKDWGTGSVTDLNHIEDRDDRRRESRDRRDRDRGDDRRRDRERDRGERRERERSKESGRERERDRGDRDRDRDRDRERRRSRHSRSEERRERKRSRSRSRDRDREESPPRRERKKKSLFDVPPPAGGAPGLPGMPMIPGMPFPPPLPPAPFPGLIGDSTDGLGGVIPPPPLTALLSALAGANPTASQQVMRQAKRLYVGNIPQDITEQDLVTFFNAKLAEAGVITIPGDPVTGAQLGTEGNFAFIEFRTPEEATLGMNLDGVQYNGITFRVRRPKDYTPLPNEASMLQPLIPGIVSTNVPDTPNKLYIGGLPAQMNEDQVKEMLKTFGELKAFNLVKDTTSGLSKGYAFCEYLDENVTERAISGLHGMPMGDKTLTVQRAVLNQKNAGSPSSMAPMTFPGLLPMPGFLNLGMAPMDPMKAIVTNMLNLNIRPEAAVAGVIGLPGHKVAPTRVLVLYNMALEDDLADEDFYNDILEDIKLEAAKFGTVVSVKIPRPVTEKDDSESVTSADKIAENIAAHHKQQAAAAAAELAGLNPPPFPTPDQQSGVSGDAAATEQQNNEAPSESSNAAEKPKKLSTIARAYVEFADEAAAQSAQAALAGRKYNGRAIITSYHDVERFHADDL